MTGNNQEKKTPLYSIHKTLNAKMVPFGGWIMPISYSSVLLEHKAVREQSGIFDVSHMGEIIVRGANAERFLQYLTINDISRLAPGQGQYSAFLNEQAGMIDDLIIYRLASDIFFLCVNASNTDKDHQWIVSQARGYDEVTIENVSSEWSQLAVQGPRSLEAVSALMGPVDKAQLTQLKYMEIIQVVLFGQTCLIARTGYTGELGFELYIPNEVVTRCWFALMESQHLTGLQPIGLGARDTLRLEACYLLYGNDMDETVNPIEAGISWAIRLDCGDFIGKNSLLQQKERGVTRQNVAFLMTEGGIPRHGMDIYVGAEKIGSVTSGSVLPTVGGAGGMAIINKPYTAPGSIIEIDIRGKRKLAQVVKKPLYTTKVKG